MRRVALIVCVLLAVLLLAQTSTPPPLSSYAGRWQASFQGQPFFTVILTPSGNTLAGTIRHTRDIHVNDKGEVDKVDPDISEEQVLEAKLVGDHLRIVGKDADTQEENVYELQLQPDVHATTHQTVYNSGLLRMSKAEMPPNVPTLQPWKVTRVAAK